MRMSRLEFSYVRPSTIQEAVDALQTPNARIIAGGTDVMIELKEKNEQECVLVDVTSIPELTQIRVTETTLEIGAAVTFTDISLHPVICSEYSALAKAASLVGSPQIRNRGTVGGNLSTGSSAGDSICPLTAFGADLIIVGAAGEETINIADFWTWDGRKQLSTKAVLYKVILPRRSPAAQSSFIKLGRRESLAISRLSVSLAVWSNETGVITKATAAVGSAGRYAYCVPEVSAVFVGKTLETATGQGAEELLSAAVSRALGARSTARYKAQAVKALCGQAINNLQN